MRVRGIAAGLAAAMAVLVAAGPARGDDAMLTNAGGIFAASGSQVLWFQEGPPAPDGGFRDQFWSGFGAAARPLQAPPDHDPTHEVPWADLGVDARGRLEAVYARCDSQSHCAVYTYAFSGRRERRMDNSRCPEADPLLDHGVLIFVRTGTFLLPTASSLHAFSTRRCRAGFWIKRAARKPTPLRLPAGCIPTEFTDGFLACVREREVNNQDGTFGDTDEILTLRLGHQRRWRLATRSGYTSSRSGDFGFRLLSPVISGGYVYWSKSDAGNPAGVVYIQRRRLTGGPVQTLTRDGRVHGYRGRIFAVADGTLYYTVTQEANLQDVYLLCRVRVTPGVFR